MNGSSRSITTHECSDGSWKVFIRTGYVQAMREGVNEGVSEGVNEGVFSLFEEYKSKLKGDDRKLFKSYFDGIK